MSHEIWAWGGFLLFVIALLALDLGLFQRKNHIIGIRESLFWTGFWIFLALLFNLGIYWVKGPQVGLEFLTGYLLEKSLSLDNLFVFILVFNYFGVHPLHQHKVLFWGILGALIMRGIFVIVGVALVRQFEWMLYLFGVFLVLTGIKMFFEKGKEIHPEKNVILRMVRKVVPVAESYEGDRFLIRQAGRWMVTPLFIVLLVI